MAIKGMFARAAAKRAGRKYSQQLAGRLTRRARGMYTAKAGARKVGRGVKRAAIGATKGRRKYITGGVGAAALGGGGYAVYRRRKRKSARR